MTTQTRPPPIPEPARARRSGLATASLVLGILGVTCLLPLVGAVLAIVFGIIASAKISQSRGLMTGQGRATAGIVLGAAGLTMIPIMAGMLLPAVASAREKARLVQCLNNMKQISLAVDMYAGAHDGKIPRKFDDLRPYASKLDELLICPSAKDVAHPSYQIVLGGGQWKSYETVGVVVVSESASNHRRGHHVLFGDGVVEFQPNTPRNP